MAKSKMLTKRNFNIFTFVSIVIIAVLLILMLANSIPVEWFTVILGFCIFLFVVRIVLRIYFSIRDKKESGG